ncbi:adenylosuccinate synthase [Ruminococcaceae bacterium OttesenSCG-928-I18]|nr:adenylosuccinate synthase [Ruminococcaceae bacterium OttesenSCG-928-I18]
MLTAISGINWGDEGKGRMVDLISEHYDVVVRYQGGNNAGHTVVNERGKFILNLLPSGILREEVVNVMGTGMVIDLDHLSTEIAKLRSREVALSPDNLKISERASICLPYHRKLDNLEEDRLGKNAYGSTRRGIAPCYSDKYLKKTLRMGDLLHLPDLKDRLKDTITQKNLLLEKVYGGEPEDFEELYGWLQCYAAEFAPYICDTGLYLDSAAEKGKDILFEAQLGALRDVDFGIIPFTSSSNTIAAYAPIGAGVPGRRLDKSIGVTKAYSTCVGEGPFVAEWQGEDAEKLRTEGNEFGAATGRPRRVGGFDVVASRYGCRMQGATEVVLTMLDVLSYLDEIPICTAYTIDGNPTMDFPYGAQLDRARPVFKSVKGWGTDISGIRKKEDLPRAARDYIENIERVLETPVTMVSVGPGRDAYIEMT